MSKEWFIEAHERAVAEYMDRYPNASWSDAYDRMRDEMADAADTLRQRAKDGEDADNERA